MIRIKIYHEERDKTELIGEMRIKRVSEPRDTERGDYSIEMGIERKGSAVGIYRRGLIGFERWKYNAWGLVKEALALYDEEVLSLEGPLEDFASTDPPRSIVRRLLDRQSYGK